MFKIVTSYSQVIHKLAFCKQLSYKP